MSWLLTVLLVLATSLISFIYWQMTYWRKRGIPYIRGYPVIGILGPTFCRKKSFMEVVHDSYRSCPGAKYVGSLDFSVPVIVLKDPEIVKEVGIKRFDYFPNHRSFVEEEFDPILGRNIFSLKDDRWREMRSTLSPSFTANKMKFMFHLVSKCAIDFVQYLKDHPEITGDMEVKDAYTRYTNDVIATAAFGIGVNSMEDRNNEFYINGLDASSFDGFKKLVKLLSARTFPKFTSMLGLSFLSPKVDKFFKNLIHDTVRVRKEKGIVRPDMIHLLMQAKDNENGIDMTNDDIVAQAFIFFLAGFETSSRLMCFVSHVLAYHPDVQERLREEVDSVLEENGDDITYETLAKMKYLDMVVSETLRLYPPMPFTDRVCVKAYTLPSPLEGHPGFTVQPNTSVWIPIYGFHHDPDYFPEPEKFDPERFSDENKNNIQPYTYMPFGYGPRKCIGDRFALMESKILITQLLKNFVIKPSPKTTKEIVYDRKSFNMAPACGFWIKFERREKYIFIINADRSCI